MGLFRSEDYFEIPFRPPYEYISSASFAACSLLTFGLPYMFKLPASPGYFTGALCAALAGYEAYKGYKVHKDILELEKGALTFEKEEVLTAKFQESIDKNNFWLGTGFVWDKDKINKMHYVKNKGIENIVQKKRQSQNYTNAHWLHAIGKNEETDITPPLKVLNGMVVVFGTTGSGKTRFYDLMISQAIQRKEAVIFIDPKGDKDLPVIMENACERNGMQDKFLFFHPAKPEKSVRLDVLRNWNRPTEIASRIRAILPVTGAGDVFSEFSWKTINDISNAELLIGEKPNLYRIKNYISGGVRELALRTIKTYCESKMPKEKILSYIKSNGGDSKKVTEFDSYVDLYKNLLGNTPDFSPIVNDIIDLASHDKEHLAKMVPILTPILTKLTDGSLKDLLSPDDSNPFDERRLADNKKIVAEGMVLYMALDSLSDSTIGSSIGSMELADLTAVAGDRYNYMGESAYNPVNIMIDEAAEVINDTLIQMMNKGRGALFRVILATQTISDLTARLGSKEKTNMVLGNANSTIILRVKDMDTAEYISKSFDEIEVDSMDSQVSLKGGNEPLEDKQLTYSEKRNRTKARIVPPSTLTSLPDLHFFAMISGGVLVKGKIPIMVNNERKAA